MNWVTRIEKFDHKIFCVHLENFIRLGAVHDGLNDENRYDASSCPASANNIMTPNVGAFFDANAMFYFSTCSIQAFKSVLLKPDLQYDYSVFNIS